MNIIMSIAIVILFIYVIISILYIRKVKGELLQLKEYNKSLTSLNDSIRGFKHDFSNILTVIGGYLKSYDISGLEKYYSNLAGDYCKTNTLSTLNPDVINSPAVFALLSNKCQLADENVISINYDIFIDFNKIKISIYEFTRILRDTFR